MYVRFNKERRGYDLVSTVTVQFDSGTRVFIDKDGQIRIKRGSITYAADLDEVIDALSAKAGAK